MGDVIDDLSARYGERFAQIAEVGSFVVNGERAARDTPIAEGDEVACAAGQRRFAGPGGGVRPD